MKPRISPKNRKSKIITHVIPNLYEFVSQAEHKKIYFEEPYWHSLYLHNIIDIFLQISLFVFYIRLSHIQVFKNIRVNKLWQNYIFGKNYYFNAKKESNLQ